MAVTWRIRSTAANARNTRRATRMAAQRPKEAACATLLAMGMVVVPTSASWADAEAVAPIDRCKSDACREMMMKIEEKRNRGPANAKASFAPTVRTEENQSESLSKPNKNEDAQKKADLKRLEKEEAAAAARKAALEKDLAKKQAKINKEKAKKKKKGKYSLFGTLTTAGLLAALGLVVAGGGFEDLKALNGEAALEKGKKAFDESSNKYLVMASSAGVLLVDYLANLPVFNLLLPGVLELSGQVLALTILLNYITDRGGGKTQNPAEDLVKYTSELPQDFGSLVEPVKNGVLTTIDKATSANYAAFPEYVTQKWESVDTKVETGIRGGAALLLLLFSNKLLHLPLLSLLLPKTVELAGVVAALTLVQKYIVDGDDFEKDAFGFLQNTLKIPGLLPEETAPVTSAASAAEPAPAATEEPVSTEE